MIFMRYTEIAISKPFEGAPKINLPDIFGASPNKPFILKIAVTGERPIKYSADNLPDGLVLENGIITGSVAEEGIYPIVLKAENAMGKATKTINFEIKENCVLLTPLMGFTSWNAYGSDVSQEKMEHTAKLMIDSGICEYGYSYINTDSGWQKEYGGKYDAIMPNEKFPDMKKMCDTIHSYGLKCGIYSTPMLEAWGCPKEFKSIPGCTQGEPNELFAYTNTGIGVIRKEKNNVQQWTEWGFDYLKYDWSPCDPYNAELMRRELIASTRDFGFCVTVAARPEYTHYWSKYCNSYRNGVDTHGYWQNFIDLYGCYKNFITSMNKGHFFDLDMLDIGDCDLFAEGCQYTEDEQILVYSFRAFMGSPIQISCKLDNLTEFQLSVYCNEEIIALNQDIAFKSAKPMLMVQDGEKCFHAYKRKLHDGSYAVMIMNLGEVAGRIQVYLDECSSVRDLWAKKDLNKTDVLDLTMKPHTVRIFKITEDN